MPPKSISQLDSEPTFHDVVRVWRDNHCLRTSSIRQYLPWIRRFKAYCHDRGVEETPQLTRAGATAFAKWYARRRGIDRDIVVHIARCALRAWSLALGAMNASLPEWESPRCHPLPPRLLREFAEHLRQHRGSPEGTIGKRIDHITRFLEFLRARGHRPQRVQLRDVDAFVISCRSQYARCTVADICGSIRSFLRFLLTTGRISADLAPSVMAPVVRKDERPLRALPWEDVRRILGAVDRSTALGKRNYAMLLMMATYGLGAGEVIRLTLDDINWRVSTLHVVRPKTGVEFLLPLLPAVARALVSYLHRGRPIHAPTRHLFVRMKAPHVSLSCSSAVRHILVTHAKAGGVSAPYLGSHVLRHTHACRQMEQGTRPKLIGDILGHRDPESISAYVRISTERLRQMALPVPP